MDVADMDAFQAAMQSESAAEAMEYDGVLPETPVILVEAWFVLPPLSTHTDTGSADVNDVSERAGRRRLCADTVAAWGEEIELLGR